MSTSRGNLALKSTVAPRRLDISFTLCGLLEIILCKICIPICNILVLVLFQIYTKILNVSNAPGCVLFILGSLLP